MIFTIVQEGSKLPSPTLTQVTLMISAIGALGTAAFGLVDATKVFVGINYVGFGLIEKRIRGMMASNPPAKNAIVVKATLRTLEANWYTGTELGQQKSIAKSMVKLYMSADNAAELAKATHVDKARFEAILKCMADGTALDKGQSDLYARFDLALTSLLDETYQRADARYVNATRLLAMIFAVALAFAGSWILDSKMFADNWATALIVGILATPLAPIAKNLSTALSTAVNAMQAVKK